MPELESTIHLHMYRRYRRTHSLPKRLARFARAIKTAIKNELLSRPVHGLEWGDVESELSLRYVRDHFVMPYVNPARAALEIGPGGGRRTRHLLGFGRLYLVDYHGELLDELRRTISGPDVAFIKNNGTDFPGVPEHSVDFVFSFGVFVHFDLPLIAGYLGNLRTIVRPGANIVIQYADQTKILARQNPGYSDNTPDRMRQMLHEAGYEILEEDLTSRPDSSIVRITTARGSDGA